MNGRKLITDLQVCADDDILCAACDRHYEMKEKLMGLLSDVKAKGFWEYGTDRNTGETGGHDMTAEDIAGYLLENGVTVQKWKEICNTQDLPREDGEYIVVIHSITDFFGEPDEKEIVASAYFHFEQKTWEMTPYSYINALLPIFDLFDTMTTDYVSHWMPLPQPPKGE